MNSNNSCSLLLSEIATNGLSSLSDSATVYIKQKSLYAYLKENNQYLSNDTLSDFVTEKQTESIGKLYDMENTMRAINVNDSAATNALQAMVENLGKETAVDKNSSLFYAQLLSTKGNLYTLEAEALDTIRQLAQLCPYKDGPAVYQASALLSIYDSIDYINECEIVHPEQERSMIFNTSSATMDVNIKLMPNPNDGNFSLTHNFKYSDNVKLEVYDILGQLVYTDKLNTNANNINVNLGNLDVGMYTYKISNNNNLVKTDKLIIAK